MTGLGTSDYPARDWGKPPPKDFLGQGIFSGDFVAFSQRATRNTMELRLGLVVSAGEKELMVRVPPSRNVLIEPYNVIRVEENKVPIEAKKVLRGLSGVVQ
jgi:hypothetical protein